MVPAIGELAGVPIEQPRTPLVREDHPARLGEGFALGISLVTIALLTWSAVHDWPTIRASWPELLAWTAALAILNLLDVATESGFRVAPALPIIVATAVVFPAGVSGIVTFIGGLDPRELRGAVSPATALFNRSQVSLSSMLAATAAGTVLPRTVTTTAIAALVSLAVVTLSNYLLASAAYSASTRARLASVLRGLRIGTTPDFVATWLGWGLLGLLLAVGYDELRLWALGTLSLLAIVGRALLQRSESGLVSAEDARSKALALQKLEASISEERRDERRLIAFKIHDDLQQAVHRMTVLTQVIRQDLASGRLLDLDDDVPMLVAAGNTAGEALREVVRGLLDSAVGPNGLIVAIRALVGDLQLIAEARIATEIDELGELPQGVQLTAYQICREALTNAVRHAEARTITLRIRRDEEHLRLSVEDDGQGFDPAVEAEGHFGVVIMRERAQTAGGLLHVGSTPKGTIVAARIPVGDVSP